MKFYNKLRDHLSSSMEIIINQRWDFKGISAARNLINSIFDGEGAGIVATFITILTLLFFLLGLVEIIAKVCFVVIRVLFTIRNTRRTPAKATMAKAPGANLLAIADFFFSHRTVEHTFKPLVADWRTEYFEALRESRKYKARWISCRYRYSFIMAMGLSKIFAVLKQLRYVSK